ncbi:hypothetical protein HDR66_02320 [bacterium]|nr:hypothetical protein [bacterium]
MDIRNACKIFLDFIYDNKLLPPPVLDVIDDSIFSKDSVKWDIRVVLNLLYRRSGYDPKGYAQGQEIHQRLVTVSNAFNEMDREMREWMQDCSHLVKSATWILNNYFHDVNTRSGINTILTSFEEIMRTAPIGFAQRQKYIDELMERDDDNAPENDSENEYVAPAAKTENVPYVGNGAKIKKRTIKQICAANGIDVGQNWNIATLGKGNYFWVNIWPDALENLWFFVLNDTDRKMLRVLKIPANTFRATDFAPWVERGVLDIRLEPGNLRDLLGTHQNFAPYLHKEIPLDA